MSERGSQFGSVERQRGDSLPIAGLDHGRRCQPRASYATDVRQGEEVGSACWRDAARGTKRDVWKRSAHRFKRADAASLLCGKQLQREESRVAGTDDVGRRHHAWKQRKAARMGCFDELARQPGADAEAGSSLNGLLEVFYP